MSQFTCIACRVAFSDADIQRSHYKTDWHRYNLKRKVAELPSVTAENFLQRVLAQKSQIAEQQKDTSGHCYLCNKHFRTQNAYKNHLQSKKHKDIESKEVRDVEDSDTPEKGIVEVENKMNYEKGVRKNEEAASKKVDAEHDMEEGNDSDTESWDDETLGMEQCMFCSKVSESLDCNVHHMGLAHGFYIPDAEYLIDLEGLIVYLGEKIALGNICLWCNEKGKGFHRLKSVQQHMLDKGHCKMLTDGDVVFEYTEYYDYRSSYPDNTDGENQESETEAREEVESHDLSSEDDNCVLVLPSGSTVGHRSMMRYYRQNLPPSRVSRSSVLPKVLAHYKALGWTAGSAHAGKLRMRDLHFVQKLKDKQHLKMGLKANKFQPHFRNQVIF